MMVDTSSLGNLSSLPFFSKGSNYSVCNTLNLAIITVRAIFILPVSTLVLYLGYQRWRQQHSFKTSHSDTFTYHMAAMELIWVVGYFCYSYGWLAPNKDILTAGIYISSTIVYGEAFFHILTCLERYLAVVHPITYRGLKNVRAVRIRNITVGCVWLLYFGLMGVTKYYMPGQALVPFLSISIFAFIVVSFCSISILFVLVRPKPGKGGRERVLVEQSKLKTFYSISVIMAVLSFWFSVFIVIVIIQESQQLSKFATCVLSLSLVLFNLPTIFVLPLLFFYRSGKLPCYHAA